MVLAIILAIVIFIIAKFLIDKNKQASKVTMQGGMKNKYREIIGHILSIDSRSRIVQETSDSVRIALSSAGGTTIFDLTQTFGNLTIQWKINSPVFGKHKMEWDFPEFLDQDKMIERIENDLEKYQGNIMKAHGFI